MIGNYQDVRCIVVKKYKNIFGKYIVILDENGKKTKIFRDPLFLYYIYSA